MLESIVPNVVCAAHASWEWDWDAWVAIGTIVLALATFGLIVATWLADSRRRSDDRVEKAKRNVAAANNAIFEIVRFYNKALTFKDQVLDEQRRSPIRHLLLRPASGVVWRPCRIDFNSLSFLFGSNDPDVLGTLALAEQETEVLVDAIRRRDTMHLSVVQPLHEEKMRPDGTISQVEMEEELGPRKAIILRGLTDQLFEVTDSVLDSLPKELERLRKATQSMYPKEKVANMKLPESKPQDGQ